MSQTATGDGAPDAGSTGRYPRGSGYLLGFTVGVLLGIGVFLWVQQAAVAVILAVAVGTALGVAIEQAIDTRPLTEWERTLVWMALLAGITVLVAVLVYLVLVA